MWSKSQVRKSQKQLFSYMTYFIPPPPQPSGYVIQFQDDSLTTSFQELNQSPDNEELDRRKQKRGKGMAENTGTTAYWWLLFFFSNISLSLLKGMKIISDSVVNRTPTFAHCFVASFQMHSILWSLFLMKTWWFQRQTSCQNILSESIMKEKHKVQNWKCFMVRLSPV